MQDRRRGSGRTKALWIGALVVVAFALGASGLLSLPGLRPAHGDGDPLENHDFSGEVPIRDFVHQSRHRVWQHGLWTVQRHSALDPFEGTMWSLTGCTFQRINVYFGTWPKWNSATTYRADLGTPTFGPHHEQAPRFDLVEDTIAPLWDGDPRELLAVDYTDSGGLTLLLSYWNGGANGGNSAQVIRLVGNKPEDAAVEVLWSGRYQELIDLDGDGQPEIIDSDWAHHYADYLPHKGIWGSVVLDWSPEKNRYVVAHDRLYVTAMRHVAREEHKAIWTGATWMEARREHVRESVRQIGEPGTAYEVEGNRITALFTLAHALQDFLWTGHVAEAHALIRETDLPHFDPDYDADKDLEARMAEWPKDVWWRKFAEGCKRSDYWTDLCRAFPDLSTLK